MDIYYSMGYKCVQIDWRRAELSASWAVPHVARLLKGRALITLIKTAESNRRADNATWD